ncbi:protein kinase [Gemmatimonadota bacterium]
MIGKTISHYKVVDKLGEGGMGTVYRAEDTTLERLVAIKALSGQFAEHEEARERFVREAQAASSLNHNNITTIYELLEDDGEQYIVMEYVEGKTIRDMVESGRVSIRKALDIIIQAAEALEAAHNKGILHRDVKSANIMVSMEGNVKVMDFGLAHLEHKSQLTRTGTTMGTLAYSSPEQLTGALVDRRSEVFSLGVVFYELLTGRLPFKSPSEGELFFEIINNEQDHPSQLRSDVPENVEAVITKMLLKQPDIRYQSCAELLVDLNAIRNELETTTVQITTALPTVMPKKSRLVKLGIAAVVVIAGVATVLLSSGRSEQLIPNLVVVAAFENYSGDTGYEQFGRWAVDHIHGGIEQAEFARAVPLEHSLPTSQHLQERSAAGAIADPIRTLAVEVSAGIAISGGFYILDDETIQFQVRIRDIASDMTIDTFDDVSGTLEQKNEVVARLRQRVLASLAARLSPDYSSWAEITAPPRSIEAFNEFTRGLDIYMDDSYTEESLVHFNRALEIDPTYTTARLWAARIHYLIGQNDVVHMARADSLAQILETQRASMSELDQTMLDNIKAAVEWDQEGKYQAAKRGAELAPGTFWTFIAAQSAQFANRPNEALTYFEQLDPDGPVFAYGRGAEKYWNQLTLTRFALLDTIGMVDTIEEARIRLEDPTYMQLYYAIILGADGDLESLMTRAGELEAQGQSPLTLLIGGVHGLIGYGDEEQLQRLTSRLMESLEAVPAEGKRAESYRAILGNVHALVGDIEIADDVFSALVSEFPDNRNYRTALGVVAADRGDTLRAREAQQWLMQFDRPYERGRGYEDRAMIAAHLGELDEAVRLLELAVQYGAWRIMFGSAQYAPLRDHPGYQALRRPNG